MIFHPTSFDGAFEIELEPRGDDRGFFARAYCDAEFEAAGLPPLRRLQSNLSRSVHKGTLRGMHFQIGEDAEVKLVRCTHGALFDVIIDLRPESPTRNGWHAVELNRDTNRMLYIPAGFAHGFLTLTDDTEIFYQVSAAYAPGHEGGVRFDDPAIGIDWPLEPTVISEKDLNWPLLDGLDD